MDIVTVKHVINVSLIDWITRTFPITCLDRKARFALHHFCSVAVWHAQVGLKYDAHKSVAKGCAVLIIADKAFKADFRNSVFSHAGRLRKQLSIIQSFAVSVDRLQKGEAFSIKLLEAVRIAVLLRKAS